MSRSSAIPLVLVVVLLFATTSADRDPQPLTNESMQVQRDLLAGPFAFDISDLRYNKKTKKPSNKHKHKKPVPDKHPIRDRNVETQVSTTMGRNGLCVLGCSPYVDFTLDDTGALKYKALVQEMARTCDILVHVGDTKPPEMPCNRSLLVKSINWMRAAAKRRGKIALYAPGDNEMNDCFRAGSGVDENGENVTYPADFYRASDARAYIVESLKLNKGKDLTMQFPVDMNDNFQSNILVPGSNQTYSCDFDKYIELDHYAVATMEVTGSHWYLDDETEDGYPRQDAVDPLLGRFSMYTNAMECSVFWIGESVTKAVASRKRALFLMFQGMFYAKFGADTIGHPDGEFFKAENFLLYMEELAGRTDVSDVYRPLFDKLTQVAKDTPQLAIYVVHADGHRFQTVRLNPGLHNRAPEGNGFFSHHNLWAHMVEGTSRSLTMWSRFTVDPDSFQPVTLKEEWSREAYSRAPEGHSWIPYALPEL